MLCSLLVAVAVLLGESQRREGEEGGPVASWVEMRPVSMAVSRRLCMWLALILL